MLTSIMVGTIPIKSGIVDVTDPCYDKDVGCRKKVTNVLPGQYNCYAFQDDGTYRIVRNCICHNDYDGSEKIRKCKKKSIGFIGVDAALAGYYENKPDFNDYDWDDLILNKIKGEKYYIHRLETGDGFITSSGWGDGSYEVFVYKNNAGKVVKLEIVFMREGRYNYA